MLRRRLFCTAAATAVSSQSVTPSATCTAQWRQATSRGQFNPLHDFSAGVVDAQCRAKNEKEFEKMIANPGPLRVGYSSDYLDWLYRAYRAKMKYADMRAKAEKVFSGALFTQQQSTHHANSAALTDREREAIAALPGAPPPGRFLRPSHSTRRISGEYKRAEAQKTLDRVALSQGMLDLFERQPQYPTIHIDSASRFHIVELFKELVLDRALEPNEVWDKALLYRAILSERKASYPPAFKYIFADVENTVLSASTVPAADSAAGAADSQATSSTASALSTRCPSEDDYRYFLFLVKRYYIDNAVEGHVILRCHRAANAQDLLFSNPPPKDEHEVKRSIFASAAADAATPEGGEPSSKGASARAVNTSGVIRAPTQYPPIEALWRCEENFPLLKVLVFGELNLLVSVNPFTKFPNAQAFLTRPAAAQSVAASANATSLSNDVSGAGGRSSRAGGQHRGQSGAASLASLIAERRGHLVAPLPRHVATALDARANDLRRLQQRHQREDAAGFHQKVLRGAHAESAPVSFSSYADWAYFNPRAVRAEARDSLHREAVEALKQYDRASQDIYRHGYEEVEQASTVRPTEQRGAFPSYVPTLPHFAALVSTDPHISFLKHVALPSHAQAARVHPNEAEPLSKADQLDQLVSQLASALHKTALEYTTESLRRVNHQKVQVAASLLDGFVRREWSAMLESGDAEHGSSVSGIARRLGSYKPFENRALDEAGFTTDARMEDYQRWMRHPTRAEASTR